MVGLIRLSRGDRFAKDFEVLRMVAQGGMGTVYAVHDHAAGEARALKLLLPELVADEKSRRRFTQEARIASSIESPHVPQVFRGGIDPVSVTPYIVMELLSGEDLRERIHRDGAMSPEEVLFVLEQLTHALSAAHRAGIVHRDLKAENVYLHRDADGEESVKLLDFGVAKLIEAHRTSATGTGAVGSPMWMAPEQTSTGGRIAPATDVWALGLLTFYMLTGKMFWKAAFEPTGVTGLLREIHLDVIPPASRRAELVAPGVALPPGFDDWFEIAVARDSNERFLDASPAMAALGPLLLEASLAHATTLSWENSPPKPAAAIATNASLVPPSPRTVPVTRSPEDPDGLRPVEPRPDPSASTHPSPPTHLSAPTHPSASIRPSAPTHPSAPTRPASIPTSQPARAALPRRSVGLSPALWIVLLVLAGFAVLFVSAIFVWVVLLLGNP